MPRTTVNVAKHGHAAFQHDALITYCVVLMAATKIRIIVSEFMEARHAPALPRGLMDGWLAFVVALLGIYSLGIGMPQG